jgi:carbon storage regulator
MALTLTRKIGEEIHIGDDVTVRVADVRGKSVRLSFEAPKDVVILRAEVTDKRVLQDKSGET